MNKVYIYYEVIKYYTTTITQYTERVYITKSEKKAMKLIDSCRNEGIDPNTSYGLVKIEISEVETKKGLGVLLKERSRRFYR